jgi:hypothetical protein
MWMANKARGLVCDECGYRSPKWMGRCPQCKAWDSFAQQATPAPSAAGAAVRPIKITDVAVDRGSEIRQRTGIDELDNTLGGGLVSGSLVLIGGDPGVGKSTLLLMVCHRFASKGLPVLYASGEESARQVRLRAERLGAMAESLYLLPTTATLVVVWNDHGEAFWEHGFQTHAYNLSAEESDGILMFWSKNIVAGQWDEPTSAIDLAPTLLDLFGVPIPPEITGQPVGSAAPDRSIFAATIGRVGGVQSIIKSGIKLQYHWKGAAVRMWDRNADPFETEDLYNANNREALSLWELLLPEVERMAGLVVNEEPAPNWPDDLPAPAETTPAF